MPRWRSAGERRTAKWSKRARWTAAGGRTWIRVGVTARGGSSFLRGEALGSRDAAETWVCWAATARAGKDGGGGPCRRGAGRGGIWRAIDGAATGAGEERTGSAGGEGTGGGGTGGGGEACLFSSIWNSPESAFSNSLKRDAAASLMGGSGGAFGAACSRTGSRALGRAKSGRGGCISPAARLSRLSLIQRLSFLTPVATA